MNRSGNNGQVQDARLRVLVAGPGHMVGGQAHAARSLIDGFRTDPAVRAQFLASDLQLAGAPGILTRWPIVRSVVRPILYTIRLWRAVPAADLVHAFAAAHTAFLFGALPAICVARARKRRIVLHYHDGRARAHLRYWGTLLRWMLARCDAVVVPSAFLESEFRRSGVAVTVIPNVVDTEHFSYHEVFPLPQRLLSVRSLEPIYDVANTIQAFALLKKEYPHLVLDVYGGGSSAPRLRALVGRLGVPDVRFH